jgi:hypothetical protein
VDEGIGGRACEASDDGGQEGEQEESAGRGPEGKIHRLTI